MPATTYGLSWARRRIWNAVLNPRRAAALSREALMRPEPGAPGSRGALPRVLDLIRHIRVALLTTLDRDGAFHTRPVQTLRVEDEGTLWFFTDLRSDKADELRADMRVSLGYADTAANRYVAVSGMGTVRRDPHKAQELWQVEQRAYYPDGPVIAAGRAEGGDRPCRVLDRAGASVVPVRSTEGRGDGHAGRRDWHQRAAATTYPPAVSRINVSGVRASRRVGFRELGGSVMRAHREQQNDRNRHSQNPE